MHVEREEGKGYYYPGVQDKERMGCLETSLQFGSSSNSTTYCATVITHHTRNYPEVWRA